MHIVCISLGVYITLFRFDDIRKSDHYSSQFIPNRCYPLIIVGAVMAVSSMSNLMSGVLLYSQVGHILSLVVSY